MKKNQLLLSLISIIFILIGCEGETKEPKINFYRNILIASGDAIEPIPKDSMEYYQSHDLPYVELISINNDSKDYKIYMSKKSIDVNIQNFENCFVFKIITPDKKYENTSVYLFFEKRENKFYGIYRPTNIISASHTLDCYIERFDFEFAQSSNLEINAKDTADITSILKYSNLNLDSINKDRYQINFDGSIFSYLNRNN